MLKTSELLMPLSVPRRLKAALPALLLIAEVLCFHRLTLIGKTVIPWDLRAYHLQQALFIAKAIRAGEMPLWNPYIYCGHPFAANIQTALFYPPHLIATLLGGITARGMLYSLELELIAHVCVAGIGCYLLMKELGLSTAASLTGATSFQLGAFFASQAEHLGAIDAAAWLPLLWLLLVRLGKQPQWRDALLLSAALSMAVLAGFPPVTTVIFLSTGVLALLLAGYHAAQPRLFLGVFALAAAGSILLCAVALFPALQLTSLSVSRYRTDWMGKGGGLPLASLRSLVLPNSFHVLERGAYKLPYDITLMYLYSGWAVLVGVVLAAVKSPRRTVLPWAALCTVSVLFMLGASTPFGTLYSAVFPAEVRGALYPQEWIAPFALSLCVLGAFGISKLPLGPGLAACLVMAAALDLTLHGSNRPFNAVDPQVEPGVTEAAFAGSAELLNVVRGSSASTAPPSRIDTINDSLDWVGSASVTDIPTAGGADPMALIRYIQARLAMSKGFRWGYYYQVDHPESPVLRSWNVCCLLTRTPIPPQQLAASVYQDRAVVPGGYLYTSRSVLPRFYLVNRTMPAANLADAAALLRQVDWQPVETAIVEGFEPLAGSATTKAGHVEMERYRRNSVRLLAESETPAFLASSEANYPGWRAKLDGKPVRIYETNVLFRGIAIPAGKHWVEFQFEPGLQAFSAGVSAFAWVAWLSLFHRCRRS